MKVQELIEILETMDAEAEVMLATQREYPFESALEGVITRRDVTDHDGDADTDGGHCGSDVLLLEGEQLRRGTTAAWDAPRS